MSASLPNNAARTVRLGIAAVSFFLILPAILLTAWRDEDNTKFSTQTSHSPDYYITAFSTLTMKQDGRPKNRLSAVYMEHFSNDDVVKLMQPRLEVYKDKDCPVIITSDRGWVTSNNTVILLVGKVALRQNDHNGVSKLEIDTSDVRISLDGDYAETKQHAIIKKQNAIINGDGARVYFESDRVELLDNVRGKIESKTG